MFDFLANKIDNYINRMLLWYQHRGKIYIVIDPSKIENYPIIGNFKFNPKPGTIILDDSQTYLACERKNLCDGCCFTLANGTCARPNLKCGSLASGVIYKPVYDKNATCEEQQ